MGDRESDPHLIGLRLSPHHLLDTYMWYIQIYCSIIRRRGKTILLDLLSLGKIRYFFGHKEIITNETIFICYDISFITLLHVTFQ